MKKEGRADFDSHTTFADRHGAGFGSVRHSARVLQMKLHRSTKSETDDLFYNRRTIGVWKMRNGQKMYINLKGEELIGAMARHAAEMDNKARINRQENLCQQTANGDSMSLDFWGVPKEIQQLYSTKGIQRLYAWQAEAISLPGVADGSRNFIFSTPTSSGKSLISELLVIRRLLLQKRKKVLVILPFVSLVEEKLLDLQSKLYPIGCSCKAFHSNIPPILTDEVDVAICTIEKASIMLNSLIASRRIDLISTVVVDELHYIGDPQRGYLLEVILSKIMMAKSASNVNLQTIGMSATLPNFDTVACWLDAVCYSSDYRPVPLFHNYVIQSDVFKSSHERYRLFPKNMDRTSITVQLVQEVVQQKLSVIVFVATKTWCVNLMLTLAERLIQENHPERIQLVNNIAAATNGASCPKLEAGILKGIAYHNSDLSPPVRRLIEDGFRNGVLNCLCATSTIAAGVNLPARRVIFRSQFVGLQHLTVSQYMQMSGRAGRANLDEFGESFLICEGVTPDAVEKVKKLISAPASPVGSCLIDYDSGNRMLRLVLDGICLELCTNTEDICKIISKTLWATMNSDKPSLQRQVLDKSIEYLVQNRFIDQIGDCFNALPLGEATSSSGFSCPDAILVHDSLNDARQAMCMASSLHLAFLSSPLHSPFRISNNLALQQKTMEDLNSVEQKTAILVGVDPFFTYKSMGVALQLDSNESNSMRNCRRLILAKLLCELTEGKGTITSISRKYQISLGELQALQQQSSNMANMCGVFCQHLQWDYLALLLARFSQLLMFGCPSHLLPLFDIPGMTVIWAKILYQHRLKAPEDIAESSVDILNMILRKSLPDKIGDAQIYKIAASFFDDAVTIVEHRKADPMNTPVRFIV